MKRLLFVASLAMLAIGCQKTFVENEVQNSIGFNTEVGKQTRAIVSNNAYLTDQPFAVYAYGHQLINGEDQPTVDPIMNNVEIKGTTVEANTTWKATTGSYYWPNDPRTSINFYAYSPAQPASPATPSATAAHQLLTGTVNHTEANGFSLTDYVHSNMYVDFMVGRPVLGATYSDQDGTNGNAATLTSVPVSFNHQMTQVVFEVKTSSEYAGIDFKVKSIVLNNIGNKATYTHATLKSGYTDTDSKFTNGSWATPTASGSFTIFPAVVANGVVAADEAPVVVGNTDAKTLKTTPVTMIPQTLVASVAADPENDVDAVNGQSFTITYTISGTGVATETVVKTLDFKDANVDWDINKKITYKVSIGLQEITFAPTVASWTEGTGEYGITQ